MFFGDILSAAVPWSSLAYDAVGRLAYVFVDGHRADAVCNDEARRGVLYVFDVSLYVGMYGGIFESAVACGVERAVLKHQVLGIAQRLFACYVAVYEPQILRVPSQILAVELSHTRSRPQFPRTSPW